MEQVLAPRFNFTPKNPNSGPIEGFDYGEGGYDPKRCNVGFNEETGQFQIEIKGLAEPKSKEAVRICREDLNEVIASFVQDKTAIERGIFDEELVPEELTVVRNLRVELALASRLVLTVLDLAGYEVEEGRPAHDRDFPFASMVAGEAMKVLSAGDLRNFRELVARASTAITVYESSTQKPLAEITREFWAQIQPRATRA